MRQKFLPPPKNSQYWSSNESRTKQFVHQWSSGFRKVLMEKLLANFKSVTLACFMNRLSTMRKSRMAEFMIYIYEHTPPIFSKAGYHRNAWNLYKMFQSRRASGVTGPRLFSHLSCPFGQSLGLSRKILCCGPSKGFCIACEALITSFCNHSIWKPKLVFFRR